MIDVTYSNNAELFALSLTIKGHSGYAEHGKDIVCASASILAYTLAHMVSLYEGKLVDMPTIELASGDTIIACECKHRDGYATVLKAFQFAVEGYSLLARNYPQYVRLIRS